MIHLRDDSRLVAGSRPSRDIPVLNPRLIEGADCLGAERAGLLLLRAGRFRRDGDGNDGRTISGGIVMTAE